MSEYVNFNFKRVLDMGSTSFIVANSAAVSAKPGWSLQVHDVIRRKIERFRNGEDGLFLL